MLRGANKTRLWQLCALCPSWCIVWVGFFHDCSECSWHFLLRGQRVANHLYFTSHFMKHPGTFVLFHAEMVGKNVQFMSTNPRVFFSPTLLETNKSPWKKSWYFPVNTIKIRWILHGYVSLQEGNPQQGCFLRVELARYVRIDGQVAKDRRQAGQKTTQPLGKIVNK